MKLRVPAVVCVLLAGCSTYKPPPPPTPRDASLVAASIGQTWDAVIDLFATRNIPIRTIERASGLIVTDALRVGQEGVTLASCGTENGKVLPPDRATYNVLVRGDSTLATVRTTVLWTRTAEPTVPECTSTYAWERGLETEVKALAERQGRELAAHAAPLGPVPSAQPSPAPDPAPPPPRPPTIRSAEELMNNLGFRRAMIDAQRIGIISDFHEIAVDTIALDLADLALTSPSTDHSLSGLYLAYRGTTDYRAGSAMKLFHDGQSIGWFNKAGLAWGSVR
ncbi:MAG TPA: hypothetical protein VIJ26_07785 [Thermoanaerobaculia bacterium]